jgi:hypothetical protein
MLEATRGKYNTYSLNVASEKTLRGCGALNIAEMQ